jgi:predicted 3-demethylubiquinone-9 3-methyltransferase (glyoxalase superfamily)
MQKITPFLWFDGNAGEAMEFYTSIFKNSRIKNISNYEGHEQHPENIMTASFEIEGQEFMVINGGPMFKFTEAISFFVKCGTQDEVDYYWQRLSDGGEIQMCGWLKDKFGVSWQIVPTILGDLLNDQDPVKAKKAMNAMLQMKKLDIDALKRAKDA